MSESIEIYFRNKNLYRNSQLSLKMLDLTDSRRAAYENRVYDNSSVLMQNPTEPYPRRSQKKAFYIIILISIIILIGLAIVIALLYNQTSSLSQQIADLQQQNTNLKEQMTALESMNFTADFTQLENSLVNTQSEVQTLNQSLTSFNTTMSQLEISVFTAQSEVQTFNQSITNTVSQFQSNLSTTQLEISSLNQSFTSLGQDATANITQFGNNLSNVQSEIQLLNQTLTALETSVNNETIWNATLLNATLLNYTSNQSTYFLIECEGGFVTVPGVEIFMSSQNGGYGTCDFNANYDWGFYGWIGSSLTLDGSPTVFISPYNLFLNYLLSWSQTFEFPAGNHTIGVMASWENRTLPCTHETNYTSFYMESIRLICTLYGVEENN